MQQDWRACPSGSGGLAVRRGSVALLVRDTDPTHDELLSALLAAVEAAASDPAPGRRLARRVAGLLSNADVEVLPDLCLLAAVDGGGVAAMLVGDAELVVTTDEGEEELSGLDVATWVDRVLRPPLQQVSAVLSGSTAGTGSTRCDLRDGVVPAGALVLTPAGTPSGPAEPAPAAPASEPAPATAGPAPAEPGTEGAATGEPAVAAPAPVPAHASAAVDVAHELVGAGASSAVAEPVALAEPPSGSPATAPVAVAVGQAAPESRADVPAQASPPTGATPSSRATFTSISFVEPLPAEELVPLPVEDEQDDVVTVLGITCSRGHFNDPASVYCASCGISLVHQTHNLVPGPRSPLGVLVTDDGSVFTLTKDYVIGREPENSERVAEQGALPLPLQDPDRTLSRVHAAVLLQDWDVRVTDLGSANGTFIRPHGQTDWERLVPHEPRTIRSGTTIRVGARTLDFDSHRR